MTREDIIRMAREAWFGDGPENVHVPKELERFAALVAAAAIEQERKEFAIHAVDIARKAVKEENEACAKVCEELRTPSYLSISEGSVWDTGTLMCADAIRARGQA